MAKTAVFVVQSDSLKGIEGETAMRVIRQLFREGHETPDIFELDKESLFTIGDLCRYKGYDVFVIIYGVLFVTSEGVHALSMIARERKEFSVVAPVCNESKISHQWYAPPFFYQTLSVFRWAAAEIYKTLKDDVVGVDEIDDFCIVMREEVLARLPKSSSVHSLPQILKNSGLRCGIAKGVYAHRYGNCYDSGRDDLMVHIPFDAREILDVGSARGAFGEMIKKRQRCVVTGVDTDSESITVARHRLDNIIHGDIEEITRKGILGKYDCIVCGDVIEHLPNPWNVVKGLKNYLRDGGVFIASTPNIMNWAIVFEQLKGRWDYVPFSILSGTHIRFFTKKTFTELFQEEGYKIRKVLLQSFEIPPQGLEFIAGIKNIFPGINEEELKASEIVVVAER